MEVIQYEIPCQTETYKLCKTAEVVYYVLSQTEPRITG